MIGKNHPQEAPYKDVDAYLHDVQFNNIKVEDDAATLDHIRHNGYYQVGDKNFNFRYNALEYASRNGQTPVWEFNTNKFKAINWRQSAGGDIRHYYIQRAEQLRNKYNYLILSFSGGSDSTTILQTFLRNNIHLDEIVCDWPLKATESLRISRDPHPTNHYSEWELTVKPMLEHVRTHYPKVKITILDYSENLIVDDQEDTFTISHMGPYQSSRRYREIARRLEKVNQTHACAAVIMGSEKPQIAIERNIFCVYFTDAHTFFKTSGNDPVRHVEYFFWAADMPELVREQAHCLYQNVLANPYLRTIFAKEPRSLGGTPEQDLEQRTRDRNKLNLIKKIIYPDWNTSWFQADKSDSLIYNTQSTWILEGDNPAGRSWEGALMNRLHTFDPKFLSFFPNSHRVHSIKSFYSRLYPIGILPS